MRLSPVLVATVAWVTLGNSNPASGQTTENNWATAIKLLNKSQNAASRKSAQRIASPSVERALGDRGQELGDGEKDTSLIPNPQPPISPSPQPPISPSPHLRAEKVVEEITISELSISPFEVQNTSKAELKQEVQAHINIFPATILPPYQGHYSPKDTKGNLIELPVQQSTFYSLNHISDLPQKLKGLITAQAPPATEAPAIPEPTAPEPAETDTPPAEGQRTQPQTPTQPTAPPPLPTLEQNAPPSIPRTEPKPPAQPTPSSEAEPRVLVAEVLVNGVEGKLQDIVYDAIRTRPGRTTTKSQLQEDINAIFATGYFSRVRAEPTDTPLGVRVTFVVNPTQSCVPSS